MQVVSWNKTLTTMETTLETKLWRTFKLALTSVPQLRVGNSGHGTVKTRNATSKGLILDERMRQGQCLAAGYVQNQVIKFISFTKIAMPSLKEKIFLPYFFLNWTLLFKRKFVLHNFVLDTLYLGIFGCYKKRK